MTYVREVNKLTIRCITLAYVDYFLSVTRIGLHGVVDIEVDFEPMSPGFETRESHDFFFIDFFYVFFFFFVIIITVQICKFNITVSTHVLLLYYSL